MKKRIAALAASALMITGLFTGCGAKESSDLAAIKEKGTLNIGITLFDPMNYYDPENPDKLIGFDTEMAEAVCGKLGVTPNFIQIDWEKKIVELKSHNIDCVWNGLSILDDLKESIDYSDPYSANMQVCVVKKENLEKFSSLESMASAKLTAESESAGQKTIQADENLKQGAFTAVLSQQDTLLEVKSGTADVAVIDAVMAYASVGEGTSFEDLAVVPGIELSKEEYGVGFRKGSDLPAEVNKALKELTEDGTVAAIAEKYPSVLVTLG